MYQFINFLKPGGGKIVSFSKSVKNQNLNFGKVLKLGNTDFVLTFNKQVIFVFDSRTFENVDVFQRRFGQIVDVVVDESNVYVVGSVGVVVKYSASVRDVENVGVDEVDLAPSVRKTEYDEILIQRITIYDLLLILIT